MKTVQSQHSKLFMASNSEKTKISSDFTKGRNDESFSFCVNDNQPRVRCLELDFQKSEDRKFPSLDGVSGSKFCNEIYYKILSYLEPSTYKIASRVCRTWKSIIHERSWKSVTKAVKLNESVIGERYRQGYIKRRLS